ncbi:hypothetical protein [Undibacterium flavidum]|uniref:Uncharacterized protein n=1 Tax=Undibacterium flavidum TaxID=2762297 RepID=A0ABR6YHQ9_9BURK|nr:hypothetical protein [Undibacterium flavidum]MBC3876119.1 hypothetical protein [Undibacterium flavidum]
MKNQYVEEVAVILRSNNPLPRVDLHKSLKQFGFISEDDFYYLRRKGKVASWETDCLMTINVFSANSDTYETEDDIEEGICSNWDSLHISYLMASLPREFINTFVSEIEKIKLRFALQLVFEDITMEVSELTLKLSKIADDLEKFGGVGSKELKILISYEYG